MLGGCLGVGFAEEHFWGEREGMGGTQLLMASFVLEKR